MSSYTIELRHVCEIYSREEVENWFKDYELSDYLTEKQIAQIQKFNIWSKEKLARKIIDHYFMREIAFETPALFKHYAKVYMQEIMERKLPLIYSNFLEYDPLINVDFEETFTRNVNGENSSEGTSNSNSTNTSEGMNILNDTPQTNISRQELESGIHASNVNQSDTASNIKDETKSSSTGSSNSTEEYTRKQKGNSGSITTAQNLVKQYRDVTIAVDEDIIKELNKLFMCIY